MTTPKYQIGQQVWLAKWEVAPERLTCPDCGGTGQITCKLFDGTEVSVECAGCRSGYEPPRGWVTGFRRSPTAEFTTIIGVEVKGEGFCYNTKGGWDIEEHHLCLGQVEALAIATTMCEAANKAERDRFLTKEKDTRSWSWHVHYHRNCIRKAEKDIEYHRAKLAIARVKAKEPDVAT